MALHRGDLFLELFAALEVLGHVVPPLLGGVHDHATAPAGGKEKIFCIHVHIQLLKWLIRPIIKIVYLDLGLVLWWL